MNMLLIWMKKKNENCIDLKLLFETSGNLQGFVGTRKLAGTCGDFRDRGLAETYGILRELAGTTRNLQELARTCGKHVYSSNFIY